jgi:type III restriction enzyme
MSESFFEKPILNSPYEYPRRHWELDVTGQPTNRIVEQRRSAKYVTPIPKAKKQKKGQKEILWVPGVNHRGDWGRWAFAEFTDVWSMEIDFASIQEKVSPKVLIDDLLQAELRGDQSEVAA